VPRFTGEYDEDDRKTGMRGLGPALHHLSKQIEFGSKRMIRSLGIGRSAEDLRAGWIGYFALGIILILTGIAAMLMPDHSNFATSTILGAVLVIAGGATVIHAITIRGEHGYYWELLKGAAETAGGILIYLSPIKGAAAMTLAVAIVLLAQGVGQIGCGIKIKPQGGWLILALAGVASLVIGAMLIFKFPFERIEQPGAMAGLALALAGVAYIVMALARRNLKPERAA
jgi:uncharacterized membrane protein HdeD (DUF308 family)